MHPELAFESDMVAMLSEHRDLAELLLDSSEAELVQRGLHPGDAIDDVA